MTAVRRLALPLVALFAGLIGTLIAALLMAGAEEDRRRTRFAGLAESSVGAIRSRMLVQLTLLRGAAGFINASDRVTQADFKTYVDRLRLEQNYPGVLGIGYSAYAPDRLALKRVLSGAADVDVPGVTLRPPGERRDYSVILFLEPQDRLNSQAIGFDMMSETTRRQAMEASAKSGLSQLSGRVRLVQEIQPVKQPGFLIYTPLYSAGRLRGWVYSPLRAHDLFGAIFYGADLSEIIVEVFDDKIGAEQLLYQSAAVERISHYRSITPIEIAGRRWLVRVTASPRFSRDTILPAPVGVGIAGILISMLIATVLLIQSRAARRTEEQVMLRTAELRAANDLLLTEALARQAAEAKVAQMQKMEALGQLTGGIAHDFNNMLTVVIGNLDIAHRRIGQPDRAERAIAQATEGARKAADLTQRLLAFGRLQALRPQVLDVNELVAGMADMLGRTIGEAIRLDTSLMPSLWPVCADAAQLESAILNLAINARDAMDEAGSLRIQTANVILGEGDLPQAESSATGPHVLVSISDTGHGMPPEILSRALDPFFTTKPVGKGTGLGLSQVYGFVRQSGGHMAIESVEGQGTTIRIFLPRHESSAPAETRGHRGEGRLPLGAGETILVVEDDDQVRNVSVETLRELGYQVLAASGGEDALDLLERHPDTCLVFTDVVMPGMNGRTLAQQVLERRPDIPILFTTGYTRDAIVHDGRLDEDVTLIRKPFAVAELAEAVRRMLDGSSR
jgi:signal transduction histidine kinase